MAKRKRTPSTAEHKPGFFLEKEKMMGAVQKALSEMNFDTQEEALAFFNQFAGRPMNEVTQALGGGSAADTVSAQADAMFFEAMQSRTQFAAKRKLEAVLKLDPDHVRAQTSLALMQSTPAKTEAALRKAIAAGERKLGPLLQEGHGKLWGFIDARPYLQARAELAIILASQEDRLDDAIIEHQELLRLNENDNQGIRDPLLGLLLETRRFHEARVLIKKFENDHSATWMYGKALLAFEDGVAAAKWDTSQHDVNWVEKQIQALAGGASVFFPKQVRKAEKVLIKALEFNPWCAIYLFRASEFLMEELPEFYSPGSEDEARLFLEQHSAAWLGNSSAHLWLMVTSMPWLILNGYDQEMSEAFGS